MAILRGSGIGAFSGKLGNVVGAVRLGTATIRTVPSKTKKNKKGSVLQNENRSLFTQMQYFLSPIIPFIRVGFNMYARANNMTAHNAAKSYNLLNAFTPERTIDFSKILISYGNLPGAINASVEMDDVGLNFNWDDNTSEKGAKDDDQVILLAYNVAGKFVAGMLSGARRKSCKETITMVEYEPGTTFHTWIAFISDNREHISMSKYIGEIVY